MCRLCEWKASIKSFLLESLKPIAVSIITLARWNAVMSCGTWHYGEYFVSFFMDIKRIFFSGIPLVKKNSIGSDQSAMLMQVRNSPSGVYVINWKSIFSLLQTDCFLLCFSIESQTSYDNILTKWHPEIRAFSPTVPIVLVGVFLHCTKVIADSSRFFVSGTKKDFREYCTNCVSASQANRLKKKIGAFDYVECSAKTRENLDSVFQKAVDAAGWEPHGCNCNVLWPKYCLMNKRWSNFTKIL